MTQVGKRRMNLQKNTENKLLNKKQPPELIKPGGFSFYKNKLNLSKNYKRRRPAQHIPYLRF